MQIHVAVDDVFYRQGKRAIKALGWATVSEFVRAKIREAIREAERQRGDERRSKEVVEEASLTIDGRSDTMEPAHGDVARELIL